MLVLCIGSFKTEKTRQLSSVARAFPTNKVWLSQVSMNRCVMCNQEEETIQHLFFNCSTASRVWNDLAGCFVGSRIENRTIEDWITHRKAVSTTSIGRKVWKVLAHAITWGIWQERNRRLFEDQAQNRDQLQNSIKMSV